MVRRNSFIFIMAFSTASVITIALCGTSLYLLQFFSIESLLQTEWVKISIGYMLLLCCAYFSCKRLLALYYLKEHGVKFFLLAMLPVIITAVVYFVQSSIKGIPLIVMVLILMWWSLFKLYKAVPSEHLFED
jgi:hypothetical protein